MALSIKTKEAHDLAAELSRKMGVSMTEAVTISLREKLQTLEDPFRQHKKIMALIEETAAMASPETKALDINDWLYDERGLPK